MQIGPARDYIQMGGGGWRVLYYNTVGLCRQGQRATASRWGGGGGGCGECCTTTLLVWADRASERLHPDGGGGGECCITTVLVCADRASQRLHPDGGGGGGVESVVLQHCWFVQIGPVRDYIQMGGWGGGGWRVLYYNTVGLCR